MRKKKKLQKIEETKQQFNNPAKSTPDGGKKSAERELAKKTEKKQKRSKRVGIIFTVLQCVLSLVFIGTLFTLGVLPFKYTMAVIAIVAVLFLITYATQKRKKVCAIIGRIFGCFIMLILVLGTICVGVANYMLEAVTGAPYKAETEKQTNTMDFMNSSQVFSVAEDSFNVYIRDVYDDIDGNSISTVNMIATVNPETKQILVTATPGEYYVTIPGVSNGQKDKLEQAGTFGVEASMSALSNLYETEISYYLKVDFEWLDEQKDMFKSQVSLDTVKEIYNNISHISDYVKTNMTKYEVQEFVKQELLEGGSWKKSSVEATGTIFSSYTYSSPEVADYVMNPDSESVKEIVDLMSRVEDGEILKK
ncbi:MAG: LCP family protein [Tyzzerella sp.]|nr:LCP family protein [Tyzzerella sp.]